MFKFEIENKVIKDTDGNDQYTYVVRNTDTDNPCHVPVSINGASSIEEQAWILKSVIDAMVRKLTTNEVINE